MTKISHLQYHAQHLQSFLQNLTLSVASMRAAVRRNNRKESNGLFFFIGAAFLHVQKVQACMFFEEFPMTGG